AHVYIKDKTNIATIKDTLSETIGIEKVLDQDAQAEIGVAHCNSGELLIIADEGYWLAYPWWTEKAKRPDYASHVDIHNKPGYDPCELFLGWPPFSVSQDTGKIKGSHGRAGAGCHTAWASTVDLDDEPTSLIELAFAVKKWFNGT
ncbi:MAG: hypothetical protein ACYSO7_03925, partial [Planctomycetota bacterium]